jgi:hypothetical protein
MGASLFTTCATVGPRPSHGPHSPIRPCPSIVNIMIPPLNADSHSVTHSSLVFKTGSSECGGDEDGARTLTKTAGVSRIRESCRGY